MAVAIPSQFSFEMLSRLPPQSFELTYREYRPDVEPNGGKYPVNQNSRVSIHLRGASNEMILNSDCYVQGRVGVTMDWGATNLDGSVAAAFAKFSNIIWREGATWISSSRESFNSGALPYLDNQDSRLHLVLNNLRAKLAKRKQTFDPNPAAVPQTFEITDLQGAGYTSKNRNQGISHVFTANNARQIAKSQPRHFNIPLGFYSNLINTHSVIPVGLMSSYSVNGWSIEFTLPNLAQQGHPTTQFGPSYENFQDGNGFSNNGIFVSATGGPDVAPTIGGDINDYYQDIRIMVPVVKILDPSVMQAILNLYEKTETVNVGGMAFPMSLRLNSLGYRQYQFPLTQNTSEYYFRLPSTDRSVRAVAFTVFNRKWSNVYTTDSGGDASLALVRLATRVGSKTVHEVVEDRTPFTQNVGNFLGLGERRSGACFSPFPYWKDAIRHSEHQSDVTKTFNWVPWQNIGNEQYGVISLENLDHREPEYSGSFQASGMDLTNIGGIEIDMRFNVTAGIDPAGTPVAYANGNNQAYSASLPDGYTIAFLVAYDNIHEISPSGVVEITKSVL